MEYLSEITTHGTFGTAPLLLLIVNYCSYYKLFLLFLLIVNMIIILLLLLLVILVLKKMKMNWDRRRHYLMTSVMSHIGLCFLHICVLLHLLRVYLDGWDSISPIEIHRISAKIEVDRQIMEANYVQYPVEDRSASIPAPIRKLTAKSLTR